MLIIEQNTTTYLKLPLLEYFQSEIIPHIIAAELTLGSGKNKARKLWYSYDRSRSTMNFNKNTHNLEITVTPADSQQWQYQIPIQIRVKTKDGNIHASNVVYGYIKPILSTEEF